MRGGQRVDVADQVERRLDVSARPERVHLASKDVRERGLEHACRLERLRQFSQRAVKLDDLGAQVVEASGDHLARPAVDVLGDLRAGQTDVGRQSDEVLDRPIVKVVPEPQQPPLAGIDERALACRVPFEQHVALEHGGEDGPCLLQEDESSIAAVGARPGDERRIRLLPPLDGHAVDPAALADASVGDAFERRLRDVADTACGLGVADVDEAAELSERPCAPE